MVGRSLTEFFHEEAAAAPACGAEDIALEVRGLTRTGSKVDPSAIVLDNVSFHFAKAKSSAWPDWSGAGRTEVVRAIFGADARDAGEVLIDGQLVDCSLSRAMPSATASASCPKIARRRA